MTDKLTIKQSKARGIWRRVIKDRSRLTDALLCSPDSLHSRRQWHDRLDYVLDNLEKREKIALEMFPEVEASLVIASYELKF